MQTCDFTQILIRADETPLIQKQKEFIKAQRHMIRRKNCSSKGRPNIVWIVWQNCDIFMQSPATSFGMKWQRCTNDKSNVKIPVKFILQMSFVK